MSSNSANFYSDAAIISRLGRQLVAKQETALVELIKNAYDADATEVEVSFENRETTGATLEIRDNGSGMTKNDLEEKFLRLASENKVSSPVSLKYSRRRAGRKGIGRFSAQRLGDRLTLTTHSDGDPSAWELLIDWAAFEPGLQLEQVKVTLREIEPDRVGTTLRIERLTDTWSLAQLRSCWRSVLALQQPFPIAESVSNRSDPGFQARFIESGTLYHDTSVIADVKTEILDRCPVVVEMKVDNDGFAFWRITKNAFGETRAWRGIHHDHRNDGNPPPYNSLKNVNLRAHHVIQTGELAGVPSVVLARVRELLRREGGIRLYRNGFRVLPYGEKNDDWLGLDAAYAVRHYLAPISNRNWFGVVEVSDPEGRYFEEHTSREGLIINETFEELRDLTSSVLITAASEVHADRGRKVSTGSESPDPDRSAMLSEARRAMKEAREAAEKVALEPGQSAGAKEVVRQTIAAGLALEASAAEIEAKQKQVADKEVMLRLLSSIGMTTAEFSHETGMAFGAFRIDFDAVLAVAEDARSGDNTFLVQSARARSALNRLDNLTGYLNNAVASRAMREIAPVSLSLTIEDFERGLLEHAETQETEIKIDVPAFDALHTAPMHEAELASVLLNFYTNSLKAMKRHSAPRKILIAADRLHDQGVVRLQFCDSGPGISEDIRESVFAAFFTTNSAPATSAPDSVQATGTGLGLWIVEQIARHAGGSVEVVDAPAGFSTCLELRLPAAPEEDE